jgi:putative ABC transport system permease protein
MDRLLAHIQGLSRPLLISLRNTVRRKARLALTLATLILAGAIFTGVISAKASMTASLAQMYRYYTADVNANFDDRQRTDYIANLLSAVPGVARVEGWVFASGEVMVRDGSARQSRNGVATDRLTVTAPPADSDIVPREVASGRWLAPGDRDAIVMSTSAMRAHPEWQLGSTVTLRLNSKTVATFVIVGSFPFASGEGNKLAMVNQDYLADTLVQRGRTSYFRIVTAPRDAATQDRVRDQVNDLLEAAGYKATVSTGHSEADALGRILNLIVVFLMTLALLIGLVGGLGLMGMMSMNVMERTREIGVMRSIGATNGAIMELVIVEGLLIGLSSWVGGALLGFPVGKGLAAILGQGLFGTPFAFVMDWTGLAIWLAAVVVLSVAASMLPAWNATRLTIREVLAYE